SCESDQVDAGMVHERLADLLAPAGQEAEGARWNARLDEDLDEMPGNHGRLLGRFEHHRVAGDECRDGHAARDGQGEVPRRNDHGDPAWNVLTGIGLTGNIAAARLGQADHLPGVELTEIDCLGDVGVGLAPGLAALEDLPGGQLEASLPHDSSRLDQYPCAVAGGCGRPGRYGRTRRGDGFLSMFGSGSRRATDNARAAARVGRI